MEQIQIDFEVFKALTARRGSPDVTHNDVIRELLGLDPSRPPDHSHETGNAWVAKGVEFAEGTNFRAQYKGRLYTARVQDGALEYNGERFKSPSAAAIAITGNSVNGWKFWEAKRPGDADWTLIHSIWKHQQHRGPAA